MFKIALCSPNFASSMRKGRKKQGCKCDHLPSSGAKARLFGVHLHMLEAFLLKFLIGLYEEICILLAKTRTIKM
jgi:hypothetical protein